MDTFETIWRLVNAVLLGIGIVMFARTYWRDRDSMPRSMRFYAGSNGFLIVVAMIGTIENMVQENPVGVRTVLTTIAACWVITAAYYRGQEGDVSITTRGKT